MVKISTFLHYLETKTDQCRNTSEKPMYKQINAKHGHFSIVWSFERKMSYNTENVLRSYFTVVMSLITHAPRVLTIFEYVPRTIFTNDLRQF